MVGGNMAYTFGDQQTKLSSLLGDSNVSTDDQFPTALRKKEINRGEWQFAADTKDLPEYATGTISSSQIAIPADWFETYVLIVNNVVISNDREISLKQYERYATYAGADPYYYYWEFSGVKYIKFLGSGINGQTYQLYYFKVPTTELSADSDVSLHQNEYREASVFYAASQLMQQIGKFTQAAQYREQYNYYVQRAIVNFGKKYIDQELARPDFGPFDGSTSTDRQGQGYVY